MVKKSNKSVVKISGRNRRPWALISQEKVLSAAVIEIANHGFEHARMTDIAKRAGLTVGAIYHWYKNKAELFTAALQFTLDQQHIANSNQLADTKLPAPSSSQNMHWLVLIAALAPRNAADQSSTDAQKMLLEALQTSWRDKKSKAAIKKQIEKISDQYEQVISNAMEQGQIDNNLDPVVLARLFFALPIGLSLITLAGLQDIEQGALVPLFTRFDRAVRINK